MKHCFFTRPGYGFAVLTAILLAGAAWAAIVTCPKCGYEQKENATVCDHCQAPLAPTSAAEAPAAAPASPGVPEARALAAEELVTARQQVKTGSRWTALMHLRNQSALAALAGETDAQQAAEAASLQADIKKALETGESQCLTCKGTGKKSIEAHTMGGRVITMTPYGAVCPMCGGDGRMSTVKSLPELGYERAQALRTYETQQKSKGWVAFGDAWLPQELIASLSLRDQATVRRVAGRTCSTCFGFGIESCTKCRGAGMLPCSNDSCKGGTAQCEVCEGTGKTKKTGKSNTTSVSGACRACAGTGRNTCSICQGAGKLVCEECEGKGGTACTKCKGTGQSPLCLKCTGVGVSACNKCGGTGKFKGVDCTYCGAKGEMTCKTCNGTGLSTRR